MIAKKIKRKKYVICKTLNCKKRVSENFSFCIPCQTSLDRKKALAETQKKTKRQKTRLMKCYCETCGYTIRLARKWILIMMPICPICQKTMISEIDNLDADPRQMQIGQNQ